MTQLVAFSVAMFLGAFLAGYLPLSCAALANRLVWMANDKTLLPGRPPAAPLHAQPPAGSRTTHTDGNPHPQTRPPRPAPRPAPPPPPNSYTFSNPLNPFSPPQGCAR